MFRGQGLGQNAVGRPRHHSRFCSDAASDENLGLPESILLTARKRLSGFDQISAGLTICGSRELCFRLRVPKFWGRLLSLGGFAGGDSLRSVPPIRMKRDILVQYGSKLLTTVHSDMVVT